MSQESGTQSPPNKHIGLKILLALIAIATIVYTWRALVTQLSMVWNTIVWIVAIGLMVFIYVKIRQGRDTDT